MFCPQTRNAIIAILLLTVFVPAIVLLGSEAVMRWQEPANRVQGPS